MAKKKVVHPEVERPRTISASAGLDLAGIRDMHPRLPVDLAGLMVTRAALGLQRNDHSPGAELHVAVDGAMSRSALTWPLADLAAMEQHDFRRITEDGAEAIALVVAHRTRAWQVVRRMQRETFADWLLEHQNNGVRQLVAFEVGGTDHGSVRTCLSVELAQVAKSIDVDQRWAGVVGFKRPEAVLRSVEVDS